MFRHRSSDQINNFRKFKMADGRHFENGFIAISQPESSDFDEIWCAHSMADGRHIESCFWLYLNDFCPINVKFDMKKHNYVQIQVT